MQNGCQSGAQQAHPIAAAWAPESKRASRVTADALSLHCRLAVPALGLQSAASPLSSARPQLQAASASCSSCRTRSRSCSCWRTWTRRPRVRPATPAAPAAAARARRAAAGAARAAAARRRWTRSCRNGARRGGCFGEAPARGAGRRRRAAWRAGRRAGQGASGAGWESPHAPAGSLHQRRPALYQILGGSSFDAPNSKSQSLN
jgi:hypothetical protein